MLRVLKLTEPCSLTIREPLCWLGWKIDEHRALGIGENGDPSRVEDVGRLHQEGAACIADLRRRLVGAIDPDVDVPGDRRRLTLRRRRADRADVAAADPPDQILARSLARDDVLELPAEQAAIELGCGVGIGLRRIDPARNARDISISLGHLCSLS